MHGHTDDRHAELLRELIDSDTCRAVVSVLSQDDAPMTFDEVAKAITNQAYGRSPAIRLYHLHLPKLDSLGAIEWDRETDTVSLATPGAEALETVETLDGRAERQIADDD